MPKKYKKTKKEKQKEALIENLSKVPIVQFACEKSMVSRSSYYRWRTEDSLFATKTNDAISNGISMINDLAESKMLGKIKNSNMTAIIFWLKNHHKNYVDTKRLELVKKDESKELTQEDRFDMYTALCNLNLGKALKKPKGYPKNYKIRGNH